MAFNPDFEYQPLTQSTDVRILLIARGQVDDDLCCWTIVSDLDADPDVNGTEPSIQDGVSFQTMTNMVTGEQRRFMLSIDMYFSEDEPPRLMTHPYQSYVALSYVWGDATDLRPITLDGQCFFVTQNLEAALRNLRHPSWGVRVWVDAVCINQADLAEKAAQIKMMGRIYQQAESVHAQVMLTPEHAANIKELQVSIMTAVMKHREVEEKADAEHAAKQQERTEEGAGAPEDRLEIYHGLEDYDLPPEDSHLWNSWRQLFASPYFTRMWILQEYTLAKTVTLALGREDIDVDLLNMCVFGLGNASSRNNVTYLGRGGDEALIARAVTGFLGAQRMADERARLHGIWGRYGPAKEPGFEPSRARLASLLSGIQVFTAGDARDKVFALLGLAEDAGEFLPLVNYEEPADAVFAKVARRMVELGHLDNVLRQAANDVGPQEGGPSWVPNWAAKSPVPYTPISPKDFAAGGEGPPIASVSPDGSSLLVRGCIVDTVVSMSLSFTQEDMLERYDGMIREGVDPSLMPPRDRMRESSLPMFKEFMAEGVAFVISNGLKASELGDAMTLARKGWDPDSLAMARGFTMFMLSFQTLIDGVPVVSDRLNDVVGKVTKNGTPPHHEFPRRAGPACARRKLFITSRGHLGLGPQQVQLGDQVAVLNGCQIPFILRAKPQVAVVRDCYQLVGDSYVKSLMYGEGMGLDGVEEEEIKLV
ncbi:Heterokaryon incompatibility protein 6, OR allele [Colletotrichum orbiculare MAFF 240422]|uniref:Heterokaryon incompatibility protein 6, OR allele n=1 Tax=Colletotrichum orbiculare (strain 104-T / ATCC 96160 / CBS 514.97 / LARS 414 / MAFF 240422) TaxID=1213857 RepID=N4V2F1_COLOR|nr:Heterokaryon incompatibility protein 6, OR allele [Colletotrichum orbiculare MAFF 240422]